MRRKSKCPVMMLIYLFIALLSELFTSVAANLNQVFRIENITFYPNSLTKLKEGTSREVSFLMSVEYEPYSSKITGTLPAEYDNHKNISICYRVEDPAVAWAAAAFTSGPCAQFPIENYYYTEIRGQNASTSAKKSVHVINTNFTVGGIFLGKTNVVVEIFGQSVKGDGRRLVDLAARRQAPPVFAENYPVSVTRHNNKMQHIFVGTLTILLIVANVLMGAQLNLAVVWQVIKRPLAPCVGFACQYLFMPLVSFALAHLLFVPYGLSTLGLGMFTTGCSPGGGASNGYTFLMDGNVDLSITMTFISTVAALFIMPFWMFVLGQNFLISSSSTQHINVPYTNICYSLIALVVPLIVGALIRHFNSNFAEKANKILRPFLLLIIAFICTFGVYANFYMFRLMSWRVLVAGMCLPSAGFAFGAVASLLLRQPLANVKAIAIETGIQNTGIGIVLLQLSFEQPDADLAAVVPVVVAMFTPPPLLAALAVHYAFKWRRAAADRLKQHQRHAQPRLDVDANEIAQLNDKRRPSNNASGASLELA